MVRQPVLARGNCVRQCRIIDDKEKQHVGADPFRESEAVRPD